MTSVKVTPDMIKELRERTGVGMGKCKEALDQAQAIWKKRLIFSAKPAWLLLSKKKAVKPKKA